MQLSCSRQALLSELQLVSKAVATRSAIQALERRDDRRRRRHSVDALRDRRRDVDPLAPRRRGVGRPARRWSRGRLLVDVLRSLSGDQVDARSCERAGRGVDQRPARRTFSVRTLPAEDFPEAAGAGRRRGALSLPADAFAATIDQVARAASRDETRPVLTGVLVSASGSQLRMVATDSYRLSVKETALEDDVAARLRGERAGPGAAGAWPRGRRDSDAKTIAIESRDNQIVFGVDRVMLSSPRDRWSIPELSASCCPSQLRARHHADARRAARRWCGASA